MHKLWPIVILFAAVVWAVMATSCTTRVEQPVVIRREVIILHRVIPQEGCGEVVDCYYEDSEIEGSI